MLEDKSQDSEQAMATLQTELECLHAELQSKDDELEEFKSSVTRAESKLSEVTQLADERLVELESVKETAQRAQDDLLCQTRRVYELQEELQQTSSQSELEMLRATEKLRVEHEQKLQREEESMEA